jgi:hypothetical protein
MKPAFQVGQRHATSAGLFRSRCLNQLAKPLVAACADCARERRDRTLLVEKQFARRIGKTGNPFVKG